MPDENLEPLCTVCGAPHAPPPPPVVPVDPEVLSSWSVEDGVVWAA